MPAMEESKPNAIAEGSDNNEILGWLKKLAFCDPYRADLANDSDGDETRCLVEV